MTGAWTLVPLVPLVHGLWSPWSPWSPWCMDSGPPERAAPPMPSGGCAPVGSWLE
eukprot:gene17181-23498_t